MTNLQKTGGFAALYLAAAYLLGFVLFLVVLDYPSMVDPAQRVALLAEKQAVIFSTNLVMYVMFGPFLVVLVLALYERLKVGAPAVMQVAAAIGIVWAGSLIASGMVLNAGIAPTMTLYAQDPAQAALTWQTFEAVASGLGNGNGEVMGGLMTLLMSWAGLQTGGLPRALGYLGVGVGLVGMVTTVPALNAFVGVFGVGQMLWFVWLALVLLRPVPTPTASRGLVREQA